MKLAVCDPFIQSIDELKMYLNSISYIKTVEYFSKIEDFFDELNTGMYYDVVLMAIDWNDVKTGIDYAKELSFICPYTNVVFMTSYTTKYVENVILKASNMGGFLMKPVKPDLLKLTLDKILEKNKDTHNKLIVRHKGSVLMIPIDDIVYLESQLHKINIVLEHVSYQCNERLDYMKTYLDHHFLTCHKSYIVNIRRLVSYKRYELMLDTGKIIPISKRRYIDVKKQLNEYFNI